MLCLACLGVGLRYDFRTPADSEQPANKVEVASGKPLRPKHGEILVQEQGKPPVVMTRPSEMPHRVSFKKQGFSFVPPKGWNVVIGPSDAFMQMQPAGPGLHALNIGNEQFLPDVNAVITLDDGTPIKQMGDQLKQLMPMQFRDWQFIDDAIMTINGKQTYRIAWRATIEDQGLTEQMHGLQYLVFGSNDKIYVVTYRAGPKGFAQLRSAFEDLRKRYSWIKNRDKFENWRN